MNLNNLTVDEIINYCHNGMIESVDASTLLRIVDKIESSVEDTKQAAYEDGYDEGYEDGVNSCE